MRAVVIVVVSPCGQFKTGLMQRGEQGVIQRLVPELAVEAVNAAFYSLVLRLGQSALQYGISYRGKVNGSKYSYFIGFNWRGYVSFPAKKCLIEIKALKRGPYFVVIIMHFVSYADAN